MKIKLAAFAEKDRVAVSTFFFHTERGKRLTPSTRAVARLLVHRPETAFWSAARIAAETRYRSATVEKAISILEAEGFVKLVHREGLEPMKKVDIKEIRRRTAGVTK